MIEVGRTVVCIGKVVKTDPIDYEFILDDGKEAYKVESTVLPKTGTTVLVRGKIIEEGLISAYEVHPWFLEAEDTRKLLELYKGLEEKIGKKLEEAEGVVE